MKKFHIIVMGVFLLISLFAAGCAGSQPEVLPGPETESPESQVTEGAVVDGAAYPPPAAPDPAAGQAYPEPGAAAVQSEPFKFPDPVAGTATIEGKLILVDPMYMLPKGDDTIYLVPMPEEGNVVSIPEFTVGDVPQAVVDEYTGEFRFINIPVGHYAVVVLTSQDIQAPARYMGGTDIVIFRITQEDLDKVKDLGSLQIP